MYNHQFILEPYKGKNTRFTCPKCHKKEVFTRYINIDTNEYVNINTGICNRKNKCGYHYPPKEYFKKENILDAIPITINTIPVPKKQTKISFIQEEKVLGTIATKHENYFIDFLTNIWDYENALYLAEKYRIGTSKYWNGATIFWQKDINGKYRTGKVILYDPNTGKRIKKPYNHINWVHKILKLEDYSLKQCLFGEHLLEDEEEKDKPVAIVESEKTAIMCSVFLDDFLWLACGSVNNLNYKTTQVLKGKNVVLFPDAGCYNLWNNKISKLTNLATFRTSKLIEDKANDYERKKGYDILDYIMLDNTNYKS